MPNLRNRPHYAVDKEIAENNGMIIPQGSSIFIKYGSVNRQMRSIQEDYILVPKSSSKTLYDGRYCAAALFVFAIVDGKLSVLANKRGDGTPDFQGMWNCPCGFIERGETAQQGAIREAFEECGVRIEPERVELVSVQSEPLFSNNGNITMHFFTYVGRQKKDMFNPCALEGGEADEVSDIRWIPVRDVSQYQWAFHHDETIKNIFKKKFDRFDVWVVEHLPFINSIKII